MQQPPKVPRSCSKPLQQVAMNSGCQSAASNGTKHYHLRAPNFQRQHVLATHAVSAVTGGVNAEPHSSWPLWRPPRSRACSEAQVSFGGGIAATVAQPLSAVRSYTGERMLQLNVGTRHLNPFTEVVYQRGPRRWLGLKKGHLIRAERPAPWLLDLRQHVSDMQQQLTEVPQRLLHTWQDVCSTPQHLEAFARHHLTVPNVLMMVAVAASLLALLLLASRFIQGQRQEVSQPKEDPEILARKAASLDLQRSRFRRALGAEEDSPADSASPAASMPSTSTLAADNVSSDRDTFEEWDQDTQKQWKRFMQSSRSQEIEEEQWWDIDRDEVAPDPKVFHDFN